MIGSCANKLKCVMFCEFDTDLGPQIKYQHPVDFISKEQMDSIASYIITNPSFQNHLISLKAFDYTFMGYPVGIKNEKYARNGLLFNAVFVFDAHDDDVKDFEPLVTKLAGYLTTLEVESGYLSEEETLRNIPDILKKIHIDLGMTGECTIPVNNCNTIYLKINNLPKQAPVICDHHVPVFLWSKTVIDSQHWDFTAKRVMPLIDGFNHVQKIATIANVDIALVRSALQTLVFHGVVTMIPLFLYNNMYAIRPEVHSLFKDTALQQECVIHVAKDEGNFPHFRDVFMLYCALGPGISLNALCARHDPAALGINERRLIQFGLIKKFVHKLGKYPVLSSHSMLMGDGNFNNNNNYTNNKCKDISKWLTGHYSYEEICCKSTSVNEPLSYSDLNKVIENGHQTAIHIWK